MRKSSCAATERIEDAALRMTRTNCTEIKKKKQAAASDRKFMTIECSQNVHSIVRFCLSFSLRDILFPY